MGRARTSEKLGVYARVMGKEKYINCHKNVLGMDNEKVIQN